MAKKSNANPRIAERQPRPADIRRCVPSVARPPAQAYGRIVETGAMKVGTLDSCQGSRHARYAIRKSS